jgi:hypothetical protein
VIFAFFLEKKSQGRANFKAQEGRAKNSDEYYRKIFLNFYKSL